MKTTNKIQFLVRIIVAFIVISSSSPTTVWSARQQDGVPGQEVYENTVRSFVTVNYYLKKSDRPLDDNNTGSRYGGQNVLQRILNKNTSQSFGVIISNAGEVFTNEFYQYPSDSIDRVTVTGTDGVEMPVQPDRLLSRAPGKIFKIEGQLPAGWQALDFTEINEIDSNTKLFAATLTIEENHPVHIGPCEYRINWNKAAQTQASLRIPSVNGVAVICNEDGGPVGLVSHAQVDLGQSGIAWLGKDILADEGISAEQQEQMEKMLKDDFAENIYEITVTFRPEPQEEDGYDYGSIYGYRGYNSGRGGNQELLLYGLGFVEDKLLIPGALSREQIEKIDTITVKIDDKQIEASFSGVLKQFDAMVIELQEGRLPQTTSFVDGGELARIEPFWAVFVRELAGKNVLVEYSRWIDREQAYEDKWYPISQRSIPLNSWLVDRQGRLVGLFCEARHEHDRLLRYLMMGRYNRYGMYPSSSSNQIRRSRGPQARYGYTVEDVRLFDADRLIPILSDLSYNYDSHIRHLDKDEQRRRVWLGVEYTQLSKDMVKQMDLRDQTQDGRIGLMVNRVYPDSPAARLGLTEGDVLLEIAVEGIPWPIELIPQERDEYDMPDFGEEDIPEEFEAMGLRMPRRRPWRSRENYLTSMLDDIGEGTSVKLSYFHAGESMGKEFNIEQSPRDMLSAAKYKDEKLGLTVKDLTYEVRAALRLKDSDSAVVVTQVEDGTPAALARIKLYELIRAVDGMQVDNVETFERLITQAREAEKTSARLTIEWMGKTRLADLKFEAKGTTGMLKSLFPGISN